MEMSSTPSSPEHPPAKPSQLPAPSPSHHLRPELKQVDTPLSSPPRPSHTAESPRQAWGTPTVAWENASQDKASTSRPKSPVSSTASSRGNASPIPIPGLMESVPLQEVDTTESTLIDEPEPTKNEAATPVLPPSPIPSRDAQPTPLRDPKQEEQPPRIPSLGPSSEHSRSPSIKQYEPLSWDRPELPSRPHRESFPPRGRRQGRNQRPPVTAPNNGQYRGMFEEGSSRNYGWGSTSATESWGGPAPYDAPPEFEGYRTRGRPNGRGLSDQTEKSKSSSRPDLRSLVNLTSGPIDNPLGIRPASPPRKIRIPPRSALQRGKDESKKGVVIGSDWPKNKSNGGGLPPLRFSPPPMDHPPQRRRKWMCGCAPNRRLTVSRCSLRHVEREATPEFRTRSYDQSDHTGPAERCVGNQGVHLPLWLMVTIGPTTPPRGVKRRLSSGQETPRIESWTPVHAAAVPGSNVRMGMISFSPSGRYFAVSCENEALSVPSRAWPHCSPPGSDRSVRIWDTHTYAELAKLAHVQNVISVAWMENDSGVVSLGELGEINRWTKLVGSTH